MRSRSAAEVIAAMPESLATNEGFGPSVDGYVVPVGPLEAFRGRGRRVVPIVLSITANEFSTMAHTVLAKAPKDDDEMRAVLTPAFGADHAAAAVARYTHGPYASRADALVHVWSDAAIVCPMRVLARTIAAAQPGRVWRAVFTHTYEAEALRPLGPGHGLDLWMVFRTMPPSLSMSPREIALADQTTDLVRRFVANGDPGGGAIAWPPYDPVADTYLALDTPPTLKAGLESDACDFWETRWKLR